MFFPNFFGKSRKTFFYALLFVIIILLIYGTVALRGKSPTKTYNKVGDLSNVTSIHAYIVTVENQAKDMTELSEINVSDVSTDEKLVLETERPANLIQIYINQSVFDSEPNILTLEISVNGYQEFAYTLRVWKANEITYVSIGSWTLDPKSGSVNLANLQIYKGLAVKRNEISTSDFLEISVTNDQGISIPKNKIEWIEINNLAFIKEETGRWPPQNSAFDLNFVLLSLFFLLVLFFVPILFLKKKGKFTLLAILIFGFLLRIAIAPLTSHNYDILGCKRAVRTYYEQGELTLFNTWTSPPTWFFTLLAFHAPYTFLRVLGVPDFRIYYQPILAIEVLFIKLPLILSDVLSAYLIHKICRKRNLDEGVSRLAAAVYLFNPFSIFISSIWGMFDSLAISFMLLGLYFFVENRFAVSSLIWGFGVKWYTLGFIPLLSIISFYRNKKKKTSNKLLMSILLVAIGFGVFTSLMIIPHILHGDLSYLKQVLDFRLKVGGGGEDLTSVVTFFGPVFWRIFEQAFFIHPFPNFFLYTFGPLYALLLTMLLVHLRKSSFEKADLFRVFNNATIATLLLFYLIYPQVTPQCVLWILPSLIFAYFVFHQINIFPLVVVSLLVFPYLDTSYFILGFPTPLNISSFQALSSQLESLFGVLLFLVAAYFFLKTVCPNLYVRVSTSGKRLSVELLQRIKEVSLVRFLFILLVFNLIFASNYLFSSSDRMPGFSYRQDAYGYMLESIHLTGLSNDHFTPFAIVSWFDGIYCGFKYVFTDMPLQLIYLPTLFLTDDFIFAYKVNLFGLYLFASVTMYYLTYVLTKNHMHCLVSTTAYVFSQVLAFEVFLGHLSMVFGYALIPLIVATYLKALWNRSVLWTTLCGVVFSVLLIIRPDFAYFVSAFIILLVLYFIFIQWKQRKIRVLKYTALLFVIAFSLSFPFLNERYVSSAEQIATQFKREGVFGYREYSPTLVQYLIPFSRDTNAYLGISVVFLSIIGFISALHNFLRKKVSRNCGIDFERFSLFLSLVLLVFFFISLGDNTFLYGFLVQHVPYFNVLRVPTRWLMIAQLCLSILAGNGVSFLASFISKKVDGNVSFLRGRIKSIIVILLACLILLDYSVYFVEGKNISKGTGEWEECFFLFPPALTVPKESAVYEYVESDDGLYRVLVVPNLYTTSYFYYIKNLQRDNVTFAHGYGYYPELGLQEEVYQAVYQAVSDSSVKIPEDLGENMFLLGIKYLIFQYNRLENQSAVETALVKLALCEDLEYIFTGDEYFVLYRNELFRDSGFGVFAVNELNETTDVKHLLSKENKANASVICYRKSSIVRSLEISTVSPCYIIISQSYDDGWQVYCENEKLELKIEEYKGLCYIFIPKQGKYVLSVKFTKYWSSLSFSYYYYSSMIALIVTLNFISSRRRLVRHYSSPSV